MAQKYSLLPSELLERGTTMDLQFHYMAETHRDREQKKARGDVKGLAETYTKSEIEQVYANSKENKWRKTHSK